MTDPFTNLAEKTGRTMPEWMQVVEASGLTKHTEILSWLKNEHGLTHGFANGIALSFRNRDSSAESDDLVEAQYAGAKSSLRPIYTRLIEVATALGDDVDVAPKKTGVSLRRTKQFALIEVPSAIVLSRHFGVTGVWYAWPITFCAMFLLQASYYRSVWRKTTITRLI